MNTARVSRNFTDPAAANMSPGRIPEAGKLRPGIKVLTKAATTGYADGGGKVSPIPGAAKIYNDGVRNGDSFDDIEKRLRAATPKFKRGPLTPKNSPYFSVRQCDFKVDGVAERIMELHAKVRPGDPEPRLYSVPIIFPSDDIDLVFTERFEAHKASEMVRWSENGNCMRRASIDPATAKRKRWGGRPIEVARQCDPNDCDLFAEGGCKHVGGLYFWIAGITGIGAIKMSFTSLYASMGIMDTLQMVQTALGRISGTFMGKSIFALTKSFDRVAMIGDGGKPEKKGQHIIRLEAPGLDMMKVLSGVGQPALAAPAPSSAAALPSPEHIEEPTETIQGGPATTVVNDEQAAKTTTPATAEFRQLRRRLSTARDQLGWNNDTLGDWLVDHFGDPSVAGDETALPEVVEKLESLQADLARRDARVANEATARAANDAPNEGATAGQADLAYGDANIPF